MNKSAVIIPILLLLMMAGIASATAHATSTLLPAGIGYKIPVNITETYSVTYSSNTTLTKNVTAYNITIDSGVTVTEDGHYMYAYNTFDNKGTIVGGTDTNVAGGAGGATTKNGSAGASVTTSYAGSGGGGGHAGGADGEGGNGGSTQAAGGSGGTWTGSTDTAGGSGSTPSAPSLDSSTALQIFENPTTYLTSAAGGGGGGGNTYSGASGADGVYGVAIGGGTVIAGTIDVDGIAGASATSTQATYGAGGGGGSGGGAIMIIYANSYTAGTYSYSDGSGGSGEPGSTTSGTSGGSGGSGQVIAYQTSSMPTTTLPSGFQQQIIINSTAYPMIKYNGSYANFYITNTDNYTLQPSWIESNDSGKIMVWSKLTQSETLDPSYQLYILVGDKNYLNSSGTEGIGEAPQLSSTYAEYDDGASVFNNYWNFAGTSLPSGWTGVVGTDSTVSANNGLILSNAGNTAIAYIEGGSTPMGIISYGSQSSLGISLSTTQSGGFASVSFLENSYSAFHEGGQSSYIFLDNGGTVTSLANIGGVTGFVYFNFIGETGYQYAWMLQQNDGGIATGSTSNTTLTISSPFYYWVSITNYGASTSSPAQSTTNFIALYTIPPNGVMPTATLGTAVTAVPSLTISPNPSTYGQSVTITASCPNGDTCAIDYPSLGNAIATGISNVSYTYSAYSLGAGSYSSFYADDPTLATNSTGQTLTIDQNSTYTFTLTSCGSQAYPYSCNTIGTISTHNNQLSANLYLNSNLIGSTTTTISNTITNQIGVYNYVFNTSGNTNYTSKSASAQYIQYVPLYLNNVSATGLVLTKTINSSAISSSYSWDTYYPIKLYTQSPSPNINYTLIQTIGSATSTVSSNAKNISYIPSPNQASGDYTYKVIEKQLNNSLNITLSVSTNINMTDIPSAINFSSPIQYYPILAHNPTWTAKPTSWSIIVSGEPISNQQTANTSAGAVFSSPNTTVDFANSIELIYPFTSFHLNLTNNPQMQKTLTLDPFKTIASTTTPSAPYTRIINNITGYSESTGTPRTVNFSIVSSYSINNYIFSNSTAATGNTIKLYIPESDYINPTITQVSPSIVGTDTGINATFYSAVNSFCSTNINSTPKNYDIYTVNSNGSLYTFTVYRGYSQTLTGTYVDVYGGIDKASAKFMQSFKINSNPFSLPLINGYPYAFKFVTCTPSTLYQTNYSVWGNPITIYMPVNNSVPSYPVPNISASCKTEPLTTSTSNQIEIVCSGTDYNKLAKSWNIKVYNITSPLSSTLVADKTINGTSFNYTFSPGSNSSQYNVRVVAYTGLPPDYTITVLSFFNAVPFKIIPSVASDSWIALLMILSGLAIGTKSPAVSVIFEVLVLFLLPTLGIAPVPISIIYGLITLAAIGAFVAAKRYMYGS